MERVCSSHRVATFSAQRQASTAQRLSPDIVDLIDSQARSHLEALSLVRKLSDIRCWSPTVAHARRFVGDSRGVPLRHVESAQAAVEGADLIVLVTASPTPVIFDAWVKPGACVISVGACRPNQREMDPALVARARVIVDSRAAALQESGDIVMGIQEGRFGEDHIAGELGQVAANPSIGRTATDEIMVFKSLGMAVEDVAAADLAYRRASAVARGASIG